MYVVNCPRLGKEVHSLCPPRRACADSRRRITGRRRDQRPSSVQRETTIGHDDGDDATVSWDVDAGCARWVSGCSAGEDNMRMRGVDQPKAS